MKRLILVVLAFLFSGLSGFAASLGTATRSVIPTEVQQVINVDYRRMKSSDTAMDMKAKLLPPNMKQFEDALKDIGVVPDRDMDQITLASFRTKDHGLQIIGIAQGQFPRKKLTLQISKQKIKGTKASGSVIYPMSGGMEMVFLDDWTMLFGEDSAVKAALEARDGAGMSLNANSNITDMIASVDQGAVWSVLDSTGTQVMLKSALGSVADLAEFETLQKKLLGQNLLWQRKKSGPCSRCLPSWGVPEKMLQAEWMRGHFNRDFQRCLCAARLRCNKRLRDLQRRRRTKSPTDRCC